MTSLRQQMLEDLHIRNYAPATVECYIRSVAEFARHFHKSPDQLGPEEIRQWQLYLLREKQVKLFSRAHSNHRCDTSDLETCLDQEFQSVCPVGRGLRGGLENHQPASSIRRNRADRREDLPAG